MQITLKQSEIEVALKNYVADQGISLYAKEVSLVFTAGRKEAGISVEINIEDTDIPEFGEQVGEIPAFLLQVVHCDANQAKEDPPQIKLEAPDEPQQVVVPEDPTAEPQVLVSKDEESPVAPPKSPSLFG